VLKKDSKRRGNARGFITSIAITTPRNLRKQGARARKPNVLTDSWHPHGLRFWPVRLSR
jgi:hypothetical protein